MSKSYETFGKNQCFGGPGNDLKFCHFLTSRQATINLRHHESAIRIAFSGLPHLLPKAISLLPTYMFTVIFLQHADFEKRRKRYTYAVFVPSGLTRGTFWGPGNNMKFCDFLYFDMQPSSSDTTKVLYVLRFRAFHIYC